MGSSASTPAPQPSPPPARKPSPPPAPKLEFDKPWRNFKWDQKDALKKCLEEFTPSNPDVKHIQILVVGQIGAGKSSFINSVNNAFEGRITTRALVNTAGADSTSFTKELQGYCITSGNKTLPYIFRDIMGLESEILAGADPDDIVKAVFGHLKDGYKFGNYDSLPEEDQKYNSNPNLSEQSFCLVYIVAADTVSMTDNKLIDKLKIIRHKISVKGIPQVIVMTKVDEACPLVKNDLRKIYTSKKIEEKMQLCSQKIGVPMCHIFPVKNCHKEIDTDNDTDVLILKALEQIVQVANDHLLNRCGH
ncbi:interferon-induced protein 44-like [Paramisgurnus dabryanus]|uniref:interferon-induced protein 44-like n=1 Tax=Paramisgurnus dabryanus TaxID=90735 RepID=UPI0031F368A8